MKRVSATGVGTLPAGTYSLGGNATATLPPAPAPVSENAAPPAVPVDQAPAKQMSQGDMLRARRESDERRQNAAAEAAQKPGDTIDARLQARLAAREENAKRGRAEYVKKLAAIVAGDEGVHVDAILDLGTELGISTEQIKADVDLMTDIVKAARLAREFQWPALETEWSDARQRVYAMRDERQAVLKQLDEKERRLSNDEDSCRMRRDRAHSAAGRLERWTTNYADWVSLAKAMVAKEGDPKPTIDPAPTAG